MIYITEKEVEENLTDFGKGKALASARDRLILDGVVYNTMPAIWSSKHIAGMKTYIAGKEGAHFVVMVFDTRNNDLLAVIEANRLGQVRTGALPAMVSGMLLKDRKQRVALLGSGFQAETQLHGLLTVFEPEWIRVFSRNYDHAASFAERMTKKFGQEIVASRTVSETLSGASLISSITDSKDPIFTAKHLGERYHVNLCGANLPVRREASDDVLYTSDLVIVEHLEQALRESAEIIGLRQLHPRKEIVELKDFVLMVKDQQYGRTVFKSMGIGLEDLAAAYLVLKNLSIL
ncbi:ornithine cyclodeaminase [Thermoplasmatales archaeon AK]|nr:ornithine cyclodeaminase [Thermoplasmatales archaeon AK]